MIWLFFLSSPFNTLGSALPPICLAHSYTIHRALRPLILPRRHIHDLPPTMKFPPVITPSYAQTESSLQNMSKLHNALVTQGKVLWDRYAPVGLLVVIIFRRPPKLNRRPCHPHQLHQGSTQPQQLLAEYCRLEVLCSLRRSRQVL